MPQKRDRNSEFAITLRERLIELRTKKFNLTQAEFAKHVGISTSSVGLYETGERVPDAENLFKICKACNVTSDFLMGLEDESIKDLDVRAICEFTGLSFANVTLLHDCEICGGDDRDFLDLINFLLQDGSFYEMSENIASYKCRVEEINTVLIPEFQKTINEYSSSEKYTIRMQHNLGQRFSDMEYLHRVALTYFYDAVDLFKKSIELYYNNEYPGKAKSLRDEFFNLGTPIGSEIIGAIAACERNEEHEKIEGLRKQLSDLRRSEEDELVRAVTERVMHELKNIKSTENQQIPKKVE